MEVGEWQSKIILSEMTGAIKIKKIKGERELMVLTMKCARKRNNYVHY